MFVVVRSALGRVDRRVLEKHLTPGMSLVDDLGIDSTRFVELAIALENELAREEFPIEKWFDEETRRPGERYTIESLVDVCLQWLASDREVEEPVDSE